MAEVRLDGQTIIIVDAWCPIARQIGHLLAARGANLVVNLPESSPFVSYGEVNQGKSPREAVGNLFDKIQSMGSSALRTSENAQCFEKVVQTAIDKYGAVHAVLSNASFQGHRGLQEVDGTIVWESMEAIDIEWAFKCTKAVWPHFRKRAYGRIVYLETYTKPPHDNKMIASSAAKFSHLGLAKTLAKEGSKYNITADVVALSSLVDEHVNRDTQRDNIIQCLASLVTVLFNPFMKSKSGFIYEVSLDGITTYKFHRARGASLNPETNLTPRSILSQWDSVVDFSTLICPDGPPDFSAILTKNKTLRAGPETSPLDFSGKVVVVTGAAAGLGRCYARAFAKLGAFLVVNDIADCNAVVKEIVDSGGIVASVIASVEDGQSIINTAINHYGRVDIVINNAGFVRDKAFTNMTADTWNSVLRVHLRGTHSVTTAAWPHFRKQGYGRVLNTTSTSGIYGSFGQSNYAAAKLGIVGLSSALAQEGSGTNIHVNSIAPVASTGGLAAALKGTGNTNDQKTFKPDYIVPLALLLCSDMLSSTPWATGHLYEVGCGWQAQTKLAPSSVCRLQEGSSITPEVVQQSWSTSGRTGQLETTDMQQRDHLTSTDIEHNIQEQIGYVSAPTGYVYSAKDVILYNLAIGAHRDELSLIFEGAEDFQALPTFGVIPFFTPNVVYRHAKLFPKFVLGHSLLVEHYLEIHKYPIPTCGDLSTTSKLLDVVDAGRSAIAITEYSTYDRATNDMFFYNEITFLMRGCGGFGGPKKPRERGNTSKRYKIPADRPPDRVVDYKTSEEQAAIYRLTGDTIPIHVDPKVAGQGGFRLPILHGACSMGIAGKHIFNMYGAFRNIRVRFTGVVVPGDTLRTEMWRERRSKKDLVLFQMKVIETGKACISGGEAELVSGAKREVRL